MPKKPTSAAATKLARRKAVFAYTARLFRESAAAIEKVEGAEARFKILAERFAGHDSRLKKIDGTADARLLQAIAEGARAVAGALPGLQGRGAAQESVRRAADGLDRLSDAFSKGAGSLRLLPSKSKAKKSAINARIERVHEEAVELAQDFHVKALALREAAGIEQPKGRWYFANPELEECAGGGKGCGCGGASVVLPGPLAFRPFPQGAEIGAPSGGKADLGSLTRQLDATGLMTAGHLKGLAALFTLALFAGSITCSNSCAPVGVVRVTHYVSYGVKGDDGNYYPSIGFLWVLCCACPCYYVFTEQRQEQTQCWGQITLLAGKATRSEASDAAMKKGREMASDYNAALSNGTAYTQPNGITPQFAPPQCTCWVA